MLRVTPHLAKHSRHNFATFSAAGKGAQSRGRVMLSHITKFHESEVTADGKGEHVEVAVRAGTKGFRDAHSASLPALRGAAPQGW